MKSYTIAMFCLLARMSSAADRGTADINPAVPVLPRSRGLRRGAMKQVKKLDSYTQESIFAHQQQRSMETNGAPSQPERPLVGSGSLRRPELWGQETAPKLDSYRGGTMEHVEELDSYTEESIFTHKQQQSMEMGGAPSQPERLLVGSGSLRRLELWRQEKAPKLYSYRGGTMEHVEELDSYTEESDFAHHQRLMEMKGVPSQPERLLVGSGSLPRQELRGQETAAKLDSYRGGDMEYVEELDSYTEESISAHQHQRSMETNDAPSQFERLLVDSGLLRRPELRGQETAPMLDSYTTHR